jgi:hypothetical protein
MSTNETYLAVFLGSKTSPAHGGLERAPRGGTAREDARRNRRMEGVGR